MDWIQTVPYKRDNAYSRLPKTGQSSAVNPHTIKTDNEPVIMEQQHYERLREMESFTQDMFNRIIDFQAGCCRTH